MGQERQLSRFSELRHAVAGLPEGGFVLLLDTGAIIDPEAEAMLQALYSRSPASVHTHLAQIAEKGPEKFMSNFYVGYGHKSIGDCGTITLFFEGISMLAAKAIQDWMLYAGQEVSTRYVDFSTQRFADPVSNAISISALDDLRRLYVASLPSVVASLYQRFPKQGEEPGYDKAINARAFDICRGFLPAGATTSVAWHTNLRQAADKLMLLRHHPLAEVRTIAAALEKVLVDGYPSSFGHKRYDATEAYNAEWMGKRYYLTDTACPDFALYRDDIAYDEFGADPSWREVFSARPPKTELPKLAAELGSMQFRFLLDFGSFRDIQRQRAVAQRMPLLTARHGFEKWYLGELPPDVRETAERTLKRTLRAIGAMRDEGVPKETLQYFHPMGYRVPQRITGDLPALVYLAELRATRFVHPTLQHRAHQIAAALEERLGSYGLKVFVDDEIGRFDSRRGLQDIVTKS